MYDFFFEKANEVKLGFKQWTEKADKIIKMFKNLLNQRSGSTIMEKHASVE